MRGRKNLPPLLSERGQGVCLGCREKSSLELEPEANFKLPRVEGADGPTKGAVCGFKVRIGDGNIAPESQIVSCAVGATKEQVCSIEEVEELAEYLEFCPFFADKPWNMEVLR